MREDGLPHAEFKLVHVVRHEERVKVETVLAKADREGTLSKSQFAVAVLEYMCSRGWESERAAQGCDR